MSQLSYTADLFFNRISNLSWKFKLPNFILKLCLAATMAVRLKLVDKIAGGVDQVDCDCSCKDSPFEPGPAEVQPYHRQQYP